MRGLLTLVVAMGVLIVAGVATIAVTIVHRMAGEGSVQSPLVLDEPAGSRIAGISPFGNRLALLLTGGGGPDRVVLVGRDGTVEWRIRMKP